MIDDIYMLLPVEIYAMDSGYNPCFFLNAEKADFILIMRKAGFKAIYTPGAKLYHKGSFSSGGLGNPYMMYWDGKSTVVFRYLHLQRQQFYFSAVRMFFTSIYSMLKGIAGVVLFKVGKANLKSPYARMHGILSGIFWSFDPKPEKDYNSFRPK